MELISGWPATKLLENWSEDPMLGVIYGIIQWCYKWETLITHCQKKIQTTSLSFILCILGRVYLLTVVICLACRHVSSTAAVVVCHPPFTLTHSNTGGTSGFYTSVSFTHALQPWTNLHIIWRSCVWESTGPDIKQTLPQASGHADDVAQSVTASQSFLQVILHGDMRSWETLDFLQLSSEDIIICCDDRILKAGKAHHHSQHFPGYNTLQQNINNILEV